MHMQCPLGPIIVLFYLQLVVSTPLDYFPLNSQLPPVARLSEPFSFIFAPLTFSSPYTISYSLVDPPAWLSIDSDNRRLYGTPSEQDVSPGDIVGISITVAATDVTGTTTANSTLVVSRNKPPEVDIPLSTQISTFGSFSAPSSVVLGPSREYSFSFDKNTFSQPNLNYYYAVSGDNTPLPSWVAFDSDSLSFSGETPMIPSPLQPPQSFEVKLVASDVAGFSAVSSSFFIVVGSHKLTTEAAIIALNATRLMPFAYDDLLTSLKLDDQSLNLSSIKSITMDPLPLWLRFDSDTWEFSGIPDSTAVSASISISVEDIYSDKTNVTLAINIATNLFRSELPTLKVTSGDDFSFDFAPYLWNPSDVETVMENPSQATWAHLNSSEHELSGVIPQSTVASQVEIRLLAKSKHSQTTEEQTLAVRIAADKSNRPSSSIRATLPTSASTSSTKLITSTSRPLTSPTPQPATFSPSTTQIVLAVLIPLVMILLVALVLLFCCYRKRRREREEYVPQVSAPIPGSFVKHDTSSFEGGLLQDMFNIGPTVTKVNSYSDGSAQAASSRGRTPSNPSPRGSYVPHAMTLHGYEARRSLSDSAVRETRDSWLAGQAPRIHVVPNQESFDEVSVLSEPSFDPTDGQIADNSSALVIGSPRPQSIRRSLVTSPVPGLGMPIMHEGSSIQVTPEFAYISGANGSEPDMRSRSPSFPTSETSDFAAGLGIRQQKNPSPRADGSVRVSNAWKRARPSRLLEEYKRKSDRSSSSVQTIRTSILAADEAVASRLSQPAVVHVPSHASAARRVSRRSTGSVQFFGAGPSGRWSKSSGVKNVRSSAHTLTYDDEMTNPSWRPIRLDPVVLRDSDSTWEKMIRNSFDAPPDEVSRRETRSPKPLTSSQGHGEDKENNIIERWHGSGPKHYLRSSGEWPKSNEAVRPLHTSSSPATTPRKRKKGKSAVRRSVDSYESPTKRRDPETSREERLRISQLREKQAMDEFKLLMSKPDPAWTHASPRPLPDTPPRASAAATRAPLADRSNKLIGGELGNRGSMSHKSRHSISYGGKDYADAEDGWEDLRPESTPAGGGRAESSTENLPAFI